LAVFRFSPLDLIPQLLSYDRHLRRCFHADANATPCDPHNGDGDIIADENPFSNFAT